MSPVSGSTLSRIAGSIKTEIQGINVWLGGGFKYFYFHPYLGKMNPFWPIFFQRGWFNHHPDGILPIKQIKET